MWSDAVDFYRALLQEGKTGSNYLGDFTFYKKVPKNYVKWKKVDFSTIDNDDVLAIVDVTTANAMSNDKGADKAPAVVAVELNADKDRISGSVADNIQWIGNAATDGKSFITPSDAEKMLIGISDGLRVGGTSDGSSVFSFTNNFLSTSVDSKTYYAGLEAGFMSNTWELLEAGENDAISDDIKDTQIAIFKKVEDPQKIVTIELAEYYSDFYVENSDNNKLDLKAKITGADLSDISWSSSDESIATVTNGIVTYKKRGSVVITATVEPTTYHDKASAKCTVVIDDKSTEVLGSMLNPLTVQQAKELIENNNVQAGIYYYIKGKVSKVNSGMMAMFGDMDFGSMGGSSGMDLDEMMGDIDFDMDDMEDSGFDMSSLGFDMSSLGFDLSAMFGSSDKVTYYISDDGTKDNQLKVLNGCGVLKTNSDGAYEFEKIPKLSPGDCVIVCGPLIESEDENMFSSLMGGGDDQPKTSWKVGETNHLLEYDPTLLVTKQEQDVYVNRALDGNTLYTLDDTFEGYPANLDEEKFPDGVEIQAPTYKSSDEDIAKWDEESKTIIGVSEGTAKITVKVKVIVTPDDPNTEDNEEKSYTMKRKFKLTVLTRDVEPAGKYAGDYVLTTSTSDLKDGTRLILVGTRVKDDKETDYVMGENNSMMGGGKSGSKYEFSDNSKKKIPCEDAPDGTLEVVLEEAEGGWYLNVGEDENGDDLYLYASVKKEESGSGSGSGFNMDEMMEMFNPSSGLKVATMAEATADSCRATITFSDNIATIKFPVVPDTKNNTIMLSSAYDMESMMNMFSSSEGEGEGNEGNGSGFDMGSFDMFMASFNTKKPGDEVAEEGKAPKNFMPHIYRFVPDPTFDITVGESGWSTIVTYNDVTIPEQLEAYVVTKVKEVDTEKTAILGYVEGLKGGNPYLLHTENPGKFTLTLSDEVTEPGKNLLQVSDATTDNGVYVLAKKDGEVAFYVWDGGLLGSGRVYIPAESGASLARILIDFYDEPVGIATGITDVKQTSDMKAYDLQGRRVVAPKGQVQKGLYIVNGRKVVIK